MLATWACVNPGLVDTTGQWWCQTHRNKSQVDFWILVALQQAGLPVDVIRKILSSCRSSYDPTVLQRVARQEYRQIYGHEFLYITEKERNARVAKADRVMAAYFQDNADDSNAETEEGIAELRMFSLHHGEMNDDDLLREWTWMQKGCSESDVDTDF